MPSCNTYHLMGFSYLGRGVSLHSCSSKAWPLLLTLDEVCLLMAALPDLQHGIAPLGPPAPAQPPPLDVGWLFPAFAPALGVSWLLLAAACGLVGWSGELPWATTLDLGHGVAPLGCHPSGVGSSQLLPLTSDVG